MKIKLDGYAFEFGGEMMHFELSRYSNLYYAIEVKTEDCIPYAKLTVNLPDQAQWLGETEVFVKTYSENKSIAEFIKSDMPHLFFDTKMRMKTGHEQVEIWLIHPSVL